MNKDWGISLVRGKGVFLLWFAGMELLPIPECCDWGISSNGRALA